MSYAPNRTKEKSSFFYKKKRANCYIRRIDGPGFLYGNLHFAREEIDDLSVKSFTGRYILV